MQKNHHTIICASYVLFVREGAVLLLKRKNTGYEDGNYSIPAGHVQKGESIQGCLIRKVEEETGIVLKPGQFQLAHTLHRNEVPTNGERADFFFVCEKWDGEIQNLGPAKSDDMSWFPLNNLPVNTIPYIRQAVEKSLIHPTPYSEMYW